MYSWHFWTTPVVHSYRFVDIRFSIILPVERTWIQEEYYQSRGSAVSTKYRDGKARIRRESRWWKRGRTYIACGIINGATLIIVIRALGLKRRVTRMQRAACAPHRARPCKLRTQRGSKRPNARARECNACIRTHVRAHARIVPICMHVRCNVRYAPLLTSLFARGLCVARVRRVMDGCANVDYQLEIRQRERYFGL